MSAVDFAHWMTAVQERTEGALDAALPRADIAPQRLHAAMRYSVLGGGKRVRPLLVHAAGETSGAAPEALDRAACAVELIHAYSLVHDDLPCMDDDDLRRGKPSCHKEYDEPTALLVGDALQSLAFDLLSDGASAVGAQSRLDMVAMLARAIGSRGMAGGQAIDLASVGADLTLPELEFMHIHKTGALIRASVMLGVLCAGPVADHVAPALDRYAKTVGLLFQVVDDVLDATASTATLGKTAGKDAAANKPTYVTLLGLGEARKFSTELHAEALVSLAPLGNAARRLGELADFIVSRPF